MKVNSVNQQNNRSFGMAVKVSPNMAEYLKKKLTVREAKKFAEIVERQKNNPIDISVYLSNRTERFFSPNQYGKLCEKNKEYQKKVQEAEEQRKLEKEQKGNK